LIFNVSFISIQEEKCISKLYDAGIAVPKVLGDDIKNVSFFFFFWSFNLQGRIFLEDVGNETLKSFLWTFNEHVEKQHGDYPEGIALFYFFFDINFNLNLSECVAVCTLLGEAIAKMHDNGVVHGDLTTSNAMIRRDAEERFLLLYFCFFLLFF